MKHMDRLEKPQTIGEEVFNAISHGVGAALAIAGTVLMIYRAAHDHGPLAVVSVSIFGASLLMLYLMSTLYHALPTGRSKAVLRVMDHISIFVLIAGTYTPYTLIALKGWAGIVMCAVIWTLAVVNIVLNAVSLERFRKWSMISYVGMGWMAVVASALLTRAIGWTGFLLMLAGGVVYTVGIRFYAMKRVYFAHCIWHLFVLGGSVLHFFSIFNYVL